jgi:hypothetical protein
MILSIERSDVRLAIISNAKLDDREELRFSATHPLVWRHLRARLKAVDGLELPPDLHVLERLEPVRS